MEIAKILHAICRGAIVCAITSVAAAQQPQKIPAEVIDQVAANGTALRTGQRLLRRLQAGTVLFLVGLKVPWQR